MRSDSLRRTAAGMAAVVLLAGCATAGSVSELRTIDPGNRFLVKKNYEDAYSIVLTRLRECWQMSGLFGGGIVVEHEILPRSKTASVVVNVISIGGGPGLMVDFKARDDEMAEVTVYTASNLSRPQEHRNRIVREWIEGTKTDC